jgi:hypothetical protein
MKRKNNKNNGNNVVEIKGDPMVQASHEEVIVALRQLAGLRVMPSKRTPLHDRLVEVCGAVANGKTLDRSKRSLAKSGVKAA